MRWVCDTVCAFVPYTCLIFNNAFVSGNAIQFKLLLLFIFKCQSIHNMFSMPYKYQTLSDMKFDILNDWRFRLYNKLVRILFEFKANFNFLQTSHNIFYF